MIFRFLKSRRLRRLREARERADKALRDATWRKDTRAIHEARRRMREATHALMRQEVR